MITFSETEVRVFNSNLHVKGRDLREILYENNKGKITRRKGALELVIGESVFRTVPNHGFEVKRGLIYHKDKMSDEEIIEDWKDILINGYYEEKPGVTGSIVNYEALFTITLYSKEMKKVAEKIR